MIKKHGIKRNDHPMSEGFDNGVTATMEMLEAYLEKHGGETAPEEVSGMLYPIFCLGYHLSGKDLNAFEVILDSTKVMAHRLRNEEEENEDER